MTFAPVASESDYFWMTSDTTQIEDMHYSLSDTWTWDHPRQQMPYTKRKPRKVNPPHIRIRATPFKGHKFKLGGSKA